MCFNIRSAEMAANSIVEKIKKLLNLAQSPCEAEATLAMARAQELLASHLEREVARFKCVECGKLSTGRLPRDGRHVGDGTVRYPRRHKGPDGKPCPGNIEEAEWVVWSADDTGESNPDFDTPCVP